MSRLGSESSSEIHFANGNENGQKVGLEVGLEFKLKKIANWPLLY